MTDDHDIDALASEYVIGALATDERSAVERQAQADPRLARAIQAWEQRLGAMHTRIEPVEPPQGALGRILSVIAEQTAGNAGAGNVVALQRRVTTWKIVAGSLAAGLAAVVVGLGTGHLERFFPSVASQVAILTPGTGNATADEAATHSGPIMVATWHRSVGELAVRQVAGRAPPAGRSYVVWVEMPAGSRARVVGTLGRDALITKLGQSVPEALGGGTQARVFVTIEAEGQSSQERPRGPVVASGLVGN